MKIQTTKYSLLVAALLGISSLAMAAPSNTSAYVVDGSGNLVKSGFGLCWRTGYWTPAMAIAECDPDLVKKEAPPPAKAAEPVVPPVPAPKPVAEKVTLSADTLYDFDKAVLRPEGKAKLDELVGQIKDVKLEVITAVGHADRIGSVKYNQKLSERRADSVKTYLVSKGIEPNRVYTEGKGKSQPVTKPGQCKGNKVTKKLIACLQPDRRVEIEVIGTKEK
ncbi:MAG TPA: OmpA family protein [Rhodocyclaceae bacterium]|nr:OmpA family protein [Rhodocyclaceae bacterium]